MVSQHNQEFKQPKKAFGCFWNKKQVFRFLKYVLNAPLLFNYYKKLKIIIIVFLQLLHNPKHDFGMVLFGASGTSNNLNDEMGGQEYINVVTEKQLGQIDLDFFRQV